MDCLGNKDFKGWIKLKEELHYSSSIPRITEGDIWWCSCGENIGVEINGKSKLFSRPVLVYKKLSRYGFIGIPLTSQTKIGSWYVDFVFQNKIFPTLLSWAAGIPEYTLIIPKITKIVNTATVVNFTTLFLGYFYFLCYNEIMLKVNNNLNLKSASNIYIYIYI